MKLLAARDNRSIKDAGGEQTVKAEGGSLFPDVLLFGDRSTARILQGWELKMPDTSIDDFEFRDNAETKARALGLDSFLLWNVSYARLYTRNDETDEFETAERWDDLSDIKTRASVASSRGRWEALAEKIFGHLNDLFDRGSLEGRQFIDAYRSGGRNISHYGKCGVGSAGADGCRAPRFSTPSRDDIVVGPIPGRVW